MQLPPPSMQSPPPSMQPSPPSMQPPPPGISGILLPLPEDREDIVSVASLEVALAKLDIKVPFEEILKVIREEEATKRERRAVLSKSKLSPTASCLFGFN
jgi:hypothetical protein